MPTISLCLVVRDEAEWLPRCLAAAQGYVDEVVVLDTGSTDATPAVARQLGARIETFPWNDDFAAARNRVLDLASGDWILSLDADEILRGPNLLPQLAQGAKDAYAIDLFNYLTDPQATPEESTLVLRFFRRANTIRFHGRVHEDLLLPAQSVGRAPPEIQIHHYGYLPERMAGKAKPARNLRLLRLALAEEANSPMRRFHWFSLGRVLQRQRKLEEAIAAYSQVIADPEAVGDPCYPVSLAMRLDCLKDLGRLDEAIGESDRILRAYPTYTEVIGRRAAIFAQLGRLAEAERALLDALRQPRHRPWLISANVGIRAICWFDLGNIHAAGGRLRLATQCLAKAALENPPYPEARPRLLEVLVLFSPRDLTAWLPAFFASFPSLRPLVEPELRSRGS